MIDATLIAASDGEMIELIQLIEDVSSEHELDINKTKTKIMIIARSNTLQITDKLNNFEIIDECSYLGSVVSDKGNCNDKTDQGV